MLSRKYISIFLIILFILSILVFYNKDYLKHQLLISMPPQFQTAVQVVANPERVNHFKNDYNVNFLPNTQFIDLNYDQLDLEYEASENLVSNYSEIGDQISFKIDIYKDNIYAVDSKGNIRQFILGSNKGVISFEKYKKIQTNLEDVNIVLDILIYDESLFISYVVNTPNCNYLKISKASINSTQLDFKTIYTPDICVGNLQAASMQFYNNNNNNGILIGTSVHTSETIELAQDLNSILGKILFLDLSTNKISIYSYGHRSPQGLLAMNDIIIATEHGPRGGDEINKIEYNTNYGWPISSYGEPYENLNKPEYDKSHELNGFKEPIFSFIPSIGISEIIYLPNSFSQHWQNNFILSSLNNKSLYRIKFDNQFTKIIFLERIFIGKRIRDLKYYKKLNIILLAQQYDGKLGIISIKND